MLQSITRNGEINQLDIYSIDDRKNNFVYKQNFIIFTLYFKHNIYMSTRTIEISTKDYLLVKQDLSQDHKKGDVVRMDKFENDIMFIPVYRNGRYIKTVGYSIGVIDSLAKIDVDNLETDFKI